MQCTCVCELCVVYIDILLISHAHLSNVAPIISFFAWKSTTFIIHLKHIAILSLSLSLSFFFFCPIDHLNSEYRLETCYVNHLSRSNHLLRHHLAFLQSFHRHFGRWSIVTHSDGLLDFPQHLQGHSLSRYACACSFRFYICDPYIGYVHSYLYVLSR